MAAGGSCCWSERSAPARERRLGSLLSAWGSLHLASGDLFRRALRDETPLGLQARRVHGARRARARRRDDLDVHGGARKPAAAAAPSSTASRGPLPRPRRPGRDPGRPGRAAHPGVFHIDVPRRGARGAGSGRWVCPTDGTSYHSVTDPPRVAGVCDKDGTPLVQRDDDRPEVVRARLAKQVPPMLEVARLITGRPAWLTRVDGRGADRRDRPAHPPRPRRDHRRRHQRPSTRGGLTDGHARRDRGW